MATGDASATAHEVGNLLEESLLLQRKINTGKRDGAMLEKSRLHLRQRAARLANTAMPGPRARRASHRTGRPGMVIFSPLQGRPLWLRAFTALVQRLSLQLSTSPVEGVPRP
jgi:hypothetical protein